MRVYTPATFFMLEALKENKLSHAYGGWGFAVTEALREFFTESDDEELAGVAFDEAIHAPLRLLDAAEEKFPHRRVVISIDVEAEPQSDTGDAMARIGGPISLADATALRIDVEEAESKVEATIGAIDKADLSDGDAELTVGNMLKVPLAWYDIAELGMVVSFLQQRVLDVDEGDWVRNSVSFCMTQVFNVRV